MANIYPISQKTVALLQNPPEPGNTHAWLPRVAGGLRHLLDAGGCFRFLRHCCNTYVRHRTVPDSEIRAAVEFVYGRSRGAGPKPYAWPEPDPDLTARTILATHPLFDVGRDPGLAPAQVLRRLFQPGELVCVGAESSSALIRPLEDCLADAHLQQFIVVNPMRGSRALNKEGQSSCRCQSNVLLRRHLVAEFDDLSVTKPDQARLISKLATFLPLVLVVDSGGKSLHAWFRVEGVSVRDQARFFATACLLGADKSRWDSSGWLRMPGGLRVVQGLPSIQQRILHESTR